MMHGQKTLKNSGYQSTNKNLSSKLLCFVESSSTFWTDKM